MATQTIPNLLAASQPRVSTTARSVVTAVAVVTALAVAGGTWVLPAFVVCNVVLAVIAVIDFETLKVPNRILGPAYLAAIPLVLVAALGGGDWGRLAWAFGSAVVVFVLFFGLWAASPRSLGMGDVKLAPYIALHLGWLSAGAVVFGLLVGALAAAVAGVLAVRYWKGTWKSALPYAPFLVLGALVAQLVHAVGA